MALTLKHYQLVRNHFLNILGNKCKNCGTTNKLELDHIIANGWGMSRGRDVRMWEWFESFKKGNLQILCSDCNNSKH